MPEGPEDEQPIEEETIEATGKEPEKVERPAEREVRRRYIRLAEFGPPESPYETVKNIIRAMGKLGGAGTQLTNQQIAGTAGVGERVVTGTNRFLLSTGIANRTGKTIALTDKGAQLALALDYSDAEEAGRVWRSVAAENEFFKRVLGALDIRGGMPAEEFAQYIARTAGAPNEPQFVRGGQAVVDVFLESGLVSESESGKLVVTPQYRTLGAAGPTTEGAYVEQAKTESTRVEASVGVPGTTVVVNINVSIGPETTEAEIDAIAGRVKSLREKVR